jgi:hypothetical protein
VPRGDGPVRRPVRNRLAMAQRRRDDDESGNCFFVYLKLECKLMRKIIANNFAVTVLKLSLSPIWQWQSCGMASSDYLSSRCGSVLWRNRFIDPRKDTSFLIKINSYS